jgi:hypothetical protein
VGAALRPLFPPHGRPGRLIRAAGENHASPTTPGRSGQKGQFSQNRDCINGVPFYHWGEGRSLGMDGRPGCSLEGVVPCSTGPCWSGRPADPFPPLPLLTRLSAAGVWPVCRESNPVPCLPPAVLVPSV